MDKKITTAQIKEVAQQAYDLYKTNTDGKNADYIPYLANINKNLFGISICLLNGQTIEVGDSEYRFGIESVSKVHTAILVLRQYGAKELLEKIGADATGLPFNSIIAAATVANLGLNPVTKKQVFDAELSPKITSMISTVGFYEHTGDWLYTSGIPAKTGVGGGVMGVLPGQFGISAFAPPIDQAGNSVKAQLAIKYVMNKLGLNVFNGHRVTIVD